MAKIGLSKPRAALYDVDDGDVVYSGGMMLGKFVSASVTIDSNADNNLYADNTVAETDPAFNGGTITLNTDDLNSAIMASIFGLTSETISTSVTTSSASWMIWDDAQNIPFLGIGGVIKRVQNGLTRWQGFVFPKVKFDNPAMALETQGQTITWQTQELTAQIMRSDAAGHPWRMLTTELDTEEEADAAVELFLTTATT